jgi:hypothetical protein
MEDFSVMNTAWLYVNDIESEMYTRPWKPSYYLYFDLKYLDIDDWRIE